MKNMPNISGLLYLKPWYLDASTHAELGKLYRSYLAGTLPEIAAKASPPRALDREGWISSGISYQADPVTGIAILHLEGIIAKRAPDLFCGPAICDLARLDELLDQVAADETIHTVVFDMNSPGGSVVGLPETSQNILELGENKRTVAYSDTQACSAMYYLAAACGEVYGAPSSIWGSIGTYCAGLDDSRAWEMEGMKLEMFRVGELKAIGHPGKEWTQEERDYMQSIADQSGGEFREWVQSRRAAVKMDAMQGQWFFANQAPAGILDGQYRDLKHLLADLIAAGE